MSFAYFALIVSIVSASALEIAGVKFGAQLATMAAALSLLAAASSTRKAGYDHYVRATSWGRWILTAIPLCIAAQLVPLPLSWAHPIWASAHEVLGGLPFGPITADIGLTGNALLLALAAISLLGVTILVVRNRSRAQLILLVLSGVAAVSALILDLHRLLPALAADVPHDLTTTLAGLGLMLNLAVMQLAAERAETHHSVLRSVAIGLCGLVGALVSAAAIFWFSGTNSAIAAAFGVVLMLLILVIRRLDLSPLAASALSVAALIGAGDRAHLPLREALRAGPDAARPGDGSRDQGRPRAHVGRHALVRRWCRDLCCGGQDLSERCRSCLDRALCGHGRLCGDGMDWLGCHDSREPDRFGPPVLRRSAARTRFVLSRGSRGLRSLCAGPELRRSRIAAPGSNPVSLGDRGAGAVAERQPILAMKPGCSQTERSPSEAQ
ncbi:hypothetical protein [Bradyrhizobium sp. USDA 328]|uniref:hypothetical protein n=1 Tax=Bradyrhizobium sp. USDA 328 TaxID=3156309 RepID=UPI003518F076